MVPAEPCNETPFKFPSTPRSSQVKFRVRIIKEYPLPPSVELLSSYFDKFVSIIIPSDDQHRLVEESTRWQASYKRWKEERYLRLTTPNFELVVLCKPNDIKLAEEILHSKLADTIPSLKCGHIHENDVFIDYLSTTYLLFRLPTVHVPIVNMYIIYSYNLMCTLFHKLILLD